MRPPRLSFRHGHRSPVAGDPRLARHGEQVRTHAQENRQPVRHHGAEPGGFELVVQELHQRVADEVIVAAQEAFVGGVDDLRLLEPGAQEQVAVRARPADVVPRIEHGTPALRGPREQHVGEHQTAPGLENTERLAQEARPRAEMERRLDADYVIEALVLEIETRRVHQEEGAARGGVAAGFDLLRRDVDPGDVRRSEKTRQVARRGALAARDVENRAAALRQEAEQTFHQILAGFLLAGRLLLPEAVVREAAEAEILSRAQQRVLVHGPVVMHIDGPARRAVAGRFLREVRSSHPDLEAAPRVRRVSPAGGRPDRHLGAERIGGSHDQTGLAAEQRAHAVVVRVAEPVAADLEPAHAVRAAPQVETGLALDDLLGPDQTHPGVRAARHAARIDPPQEDAGVVGADVQAAVVLGHAPDVAVERVVEPRPEAADRLHVAPRCAALLADDQLPAILGIDPDQLARRGPRLELPVVAATPDAGADVQRALEGEHRHDRLVELAAPRPARQDLRPAVRRVPLGVGLPDLDAGERIADAGVEMTVEDGQLEHPGAGRVAEAGLGDRYPPPGERVPAFQDDRRDGVGPHTAAAGGRGEQAALEADQRAIRADAPVAHAGLGHRLEVDAVDRAEDERARGLRGRHGADVQRLGRVARGLAHDHAAIAEIAPDAVRAVLGIDARRLEGHLKPSVRGRGAPDLAVLLEPRRVEIGWNGDRPKVEGVGRLVRCEVDQLKHVARRPDVELPAEPAHAVGVTVVLVAEPPVGQAAEVRAAQPGRQTAAGNGQVVRGGQRSGRHVRVLRSADRTGRGPGLRGAASSSGSGRRAARSVSRQVARNSRI